MATKRIFDAGTPLYGGPAAHNESIFRYISRAEGEQWQSVRDLMESWYADFDDSDGDLLARLRSDGVDQHTPAWWELYVHTVFRRLGFEIEIHPPLAGSTKRPDFRVTKGDRTLYVECAAITGDDLVENSAGQAWIYECIDRARNPDFMVRVDIERAGTEHPSVKQIVRPIEKWLDRLDYEDLARRFDEDGATAVESFSFRDWDVRIGALPVKEDLRGRDGALIAITGAGGVRVLSEEEPIREILRKKGKKYGDLGAPFIVALLDRSSFARDREMTGAAFGSVALTYSMGDTSSARLIRQPDGYWRPPPEDRRGRRIAGVLFAEAVITPWSVDSSLPGLWLNPWAETPVPGGMPFATNTIDDTGALSTTPAQITPQDLFGLS
ncbi:hemin-binding protein [Mycolicibacterium sp. A43C]